MIDIYYFHLYFNTVYQRIIYYKNNIILMYYTDIGSLIYLITYLLNDF